MRPFLFPDFLINRQNDFIEIASNTPDVLSRTLEPFAPDKDIVLAM